MKMMIEMVDVDTDPITFYIELAKKCLKGVYLNDEYFTSTDSTPEELDNVFSHLDTNQFDKLQQWFDDNPMLSYTIKFDCKECKEHNELHVEGTDSFFG
jgi:hypothetical protein